MRQAFGKRAIEAGSDRAQGSAGCQPPLRYDHGRQHLGLRDHLIRGNYAVDQSQGQGLLSGNRLARENHFRSPGWTDDTLKTLGAAESWNQTKLDLREAERDPDRRHAHVARHRHLESAGETGSIDRRDHRLVEAFDSVEQSLPTAREFGPLVCSAELGQFFDVGPKAEMAAAGCKDHDADGRISFQLAKDAVQLFEGGSAEQVRRRTVQGHGANTVCGRDGHELVSHVGLLVPLIVTEPKPSCHRQWVPSSRERHFHDRRSPR